jgi:hypothetical protein
MQPEDDLLFAASYDERERSHTPPYIAYAYPAPDDYGMQAYTAAQPYQGMTTTDGYPSTYLSTTVPSTLPSMTHFSDAIKREPYPDESLSPYISYGYVPGIDISGANPYDNSNPHVSHVRQSSSRRTPRS